jgi:hypothetical protein
LAYRAAAGPVETQISCFVKNHMFAAEFAWGYAGAKGDILKDEVAKKMSEEMVLQMHGCIMQNSRILKNSNTPCTAM